MTMTSPSTSPTVRRALGWAAAAGTLPYLTLKALWLGGSTAGVTDPGLLADPVITVANAVTFALDLVVVGLAFVLTSSWGRRVPAWAVLLPIWVGTGFLVPMALVILPATLLMTAPAGPTAFEPWVQPMVYGGFAWQAVFLVAAFALYARARWADVLTSPGAPPASPLLDVIARGGAVTAVLSAALHVASGAATGNGIAFAASAVTAGLAVAGAAGVLALARGGRARPALAAAWTGSAAMFSWGLYATLLAVVPSTLSAGAGADPVTALAQLTGLLGGFALAVAGLMALTEPRPPVRCL